MGEGNGDNMRWLRVDHSKWRAGITASPVPLPKPQAEFARMKHPSERGMYYSTTEGAWVRHGWTVWTVTSWRPLFGDGFDEARGIDSEGRHWEFFGYRIPMLRAE